MIRDTYCGAVEWQIVLSITVGRREKDLARCYPRCLPAMRAIDYAQKLVDVNNGFLETLILLLV